MTLGCGGYGGNITSDNISPRHLLNIKRLAYETTPVATLRPPTRPAAEVVALPKAPAAPQAPGGIGAAVAGAADRRVPRVARVCRSGVPGPAAGGSGASSKARVCAERRPNSRSLSSKSLPTSFAKTTSGRQCGRDARFWSGSGLSSHRRREISASSTSCSSRRDGPAHDAIRLLLLSEIGVS